MLPTTKEHTPLQENKPSSQLKVNKCTNSLCAFICGMVCTNSAPHLDPDPLQWQGENGLGQGCLTPADPSSIFFLKTQGCSVLHGQNTPLTFPSALPPSPVSSNTSSHRAGRAEGNPGITQWREAASATRADLRAGMEAVPSAWLWHITPAVHCPQSPAWWGAPVWWGLAGD